MSEDIKPQVRATISQKTRFEVFKRDCFKCQYCGRPAPEVLLQVDHIKPVAKGGEDTLLNYITACVDCNSGKKDRELSDQSALAKQRYQLEALQERRQQLEAMLAWREELDQLRNMAADTLKQKVEAMAPGYTIADTGLLKRWLRKYSLPELLDAAEAAAGTYLKFDSRGKPYADTLDAFLDKIPKIAAIERDLEKEPYLKDLFSVRAILRNRINFTWEAQRECLPLLKSAIRFGVSVQELKDFAFCANTWEWFESAVVDQMHQTSRQRQMLEGPPAQDDKDQSTH